MKCPKCKIETILTHKQYWCSKCFYGFTESIDFGNTKAEIVIYLHTGKEVSGMFKKTGMELLEYAISHLSTLLTLDNTYIFDALVIAKEKLQNKEDYE
jgi:hypothetical protein